MGLQGQLLSGRDKLLYEDLFQDSSRESLGHAKMWGDRIVYLGGVPKAPIAQRVTLSKTKNSVQPTISSQHFADTESARSPIAVPCIVCHTQFAAGV